MAARRDEPTAFVRGRIEPSRVLKNSGGARGTTRACLEHQPLLRCMPRVGGTDRPRRHHGVDARRWVGVRDVHAEILNACTQSKWRCGVHTLDLGLAWSGRRQEVNSPAGERRHGE
jgi:hypothetical protein